MDNAMVKRGIGAVILAIIAALLLGFLLKDKSDQRQEIVDMTLPRTPKIPSLSENKSEAANLVEEINSAKIDDSKKTIGDNALSQMKAVTTNVVAKVDSATQSTESAVIDGETDTIKLEIPNQASNEANSNPGFSFRPPNQNEEQQINTDSSATEATTASPETAEPETANDTVVASNTAKETKAPEEKFKPVIENEPNKPEKTVIKKVTKKEPTKKPSSASSNSKSSKSKPTSSGSTNEKYTIQLLATSSRSRANKLAETMTSEGYVSFITQTTRDNKVLYRVRVGGYKSRDAALKAQQGMKRRYQKNFNVQNSLVVAQ